MASLLPNPKSQFLDSNGDPLSGGKLYTYEAGTSTPKATYTTAAATVANSNPVVFDSRGEAIIFWSTGVYKIILKDSTDVEIYSLDNVSVPATGPSGASFLVGSGLPSSGLGADGDSYLRADTGQIYSKSSGAWSTGLSLSLPASSIGSLTASRALRSSAGGIVEVSSVTATEQGYLSGVTSAIQTQLDAKQSLGSYITALTGDVTASGPGSAASTIANSAVTNAKMADMVQSTIKGRAASSGTGAPVDLTAGQATELLNAFVGDSGAGGTKGLVPAPTIGDASKYLKGDGTWASVSGGGGSAYNVTFKNSTYSAVINDFVIASGASFSITLPTAVGFAGESIVIQHGGTSLSQVYTLNTTSGQTIGGIASGSYALYTYGESLHLVSDGTNWKILSHKTEIAPQAFSPTFTNSGSVTNNTGFWTRRGNLMVAWGTATAGTTSANPFSMSIPSGAALTSTYVGADNKQQVGIIQPLAGSGNGYPSSVYGPFSIFLDIATSSSVLYASQTVTYAKSNASVILVGSGNSFTWRYEVPISGWQP